MALTTSDLGNATSTTSTATLVTGSTITASVGDWLVAVLGADNRGASGVSSFSSIQDSQSNTWDVRAHINRTAGVSADGATLVIATCAVTNALSGGTVTVNFSPDTTSKAIEVYRVQPGGGEAVQFVAADATGSTSSTTSHTAATVSVTNGDTIFGCAAIENIGSPTEDSDATNGNWSSQIVRAASTGTVATSMTSVSQYKTVNATGNQSWEVTTGAARDSARSYLILRAVSTGTIKQKMHHYKTMAAA